jgi:hypothetical protein
LRHWVHDWLLEGDFGEKVGWGMHVERKGKGGKHMVVGCDVQQR